MKIILLQDFTHLGQQGQSFTVKDGYARNFLIPHKIAVPDNAYYQDMFAQQSRAIAKKQAEKKEQAQDLSEKLKQVTVVIPVRVGSQGKIYGSVTNVMVAKHLNDMGYAVDRHHIELSHKMIKAPGQYVVPIRLYDHVMVDLAVRVEDENPESQNNDQDRESSENDVNASEQLVSPSEPSLEPLEDKDTDKHENLD